MKAAPVVALLSFVLVTFDARADAGSVATAQKSLDAARSTLAEAVKRIEKDPPSTADLDAAHVAVEALKKAIDAGAENEPKDLDYARAALAARKELRTHREYVDQRRANVHIHNHRRTIDAALAKMNDRARAVDAKAPSAKDFDDARAAVQALRKAVDEGRQFTGQDAKFAAYVADIDATVSRQEKAIDDKWVKLSADKHRSIVQDGRKALSTSMATLSKGRTDSQFEAADSAAKTLAKRLEEGKPLEARDGAYRADAEKARAELADARKRMDELWSETGVARLKAEIEPAHQDLAAAGRALRGRKPSDEQLAEARTAAIVVRKLLEKFQPQAAGSQAFGQYVNDVRKTLVEVEVALQARSLDSARAEVVQALRKVERRSATEEDFAVVNSALMILEKTLETVHQRDPALIKPVGDARTMVRDARATMAKRRMEIDVQRQRAKVQEATKNAVALVRAAQQGGAGTEQIQAAEAAVAQARAALDEGAPFVRKDGDYAKYARDVKERLADLTERIAARKIALSASEGRGALTDAITAAQGKLHEAGKADAKDADIAAAGKAVDALEKELQSRGSLEKKDKGYAVQADRARAELGRMMEQLEFVKQGHALRQPTIAALTAGEAAADAASATRDLKVQKEHYERALGQFRACENVAGSMVEQNRALAGVPLLVEGKPSTAKEVIALCGQRASAMEQSAAQVLSLIRFDEAKRHFENGKGLLGQSKKTEALGQFDECISSGIILQHRNPELKERKFQVAGTQMTLPELVQQCINHKKSLRAN